MIQETKCKCETKDCVFGNIIHESDCEYSKEQVQVNGNKQDVLGGEAEQ